MIKKLSVIGFFTVTMTSMIFLSCAAYSQAKPGKAAMAEETKPAQVSPAPADPSPIKTKGQLVPQSTDLISNSACPSGQAYSSGCQGPSNNPAGGCCAVKNAAGQYLLRE